MVLRAKTAQNSVRKNISVDFPSSVFHWAQAAPTPNKDRNLCLYKCVFTDWLTHWCYSRVYCSEVDRHRRSARHRETDKRVRTDRAVPGRRGARRLAHLRQVSEALSKIDFFPVHLIESWIAFTKRLVLWSRITTCGCGSLDNGLVWRMSRGKDYLIYSS